MDALAPIQNTDVYKLLNISEDATDKEITKAYRAAALKVHPDKNPDDPEAANKFRRLTEALQLLTDAAARAAYDRVRRARLAAAERARALGEGRRRFKEQLEAAEAAATTSASDRRGREDEARLEREMHRLRRDWDEAVTRERDRLSSEMREAAVASAAAATHAKAAAEEAPTLKLVWRGDGADDLPAPQTEASLMSLCSAYGEVTSLLVRPGKRRGGVAVVEFRLRDAASRLVADSVAGGLPGGLAAVWLQGERPAPAATAPAAVPGLHPPPSAESLGRMESDVLARMLARSKRPHPLADGPPSGESEPAAVATSE